MSKKGIFTVFENVKVARDVYKMRLGGDASAITRPGQFVDIELKDFYLRRPISVYNRGDGWFEIVYKSVGAGTQAMANLRLGAQLDILTGLGNGFDISLAGKTPLLIGGGVGVPPLYWLAKELTRAGATPKAAFGFASAPDAFAIGEFEALGVETKVATVDGTLGKKGFVTDVIKDMDYSFFYACGPEPMLKAVSASTKTSGQLSFEARMACGIGACMGCTCMTKTGGKRICKDGPVLLKEEVAW